MGRNSSWIVRWAPKAAGLAGLAASPAVSAHFVLTQPEPRTTGALLPGPCGSGDVTGGRTVFVPGETITVQWTQEIPHYGFYRVAFSPNDDVGFDEYELAMIDEDAATLDYAIEVTLPECSCEACTLQVWQTPPALQGGYYACADIELRPVDPLDAQPCPMIEPPPGGSSGGPADGGSDGTGGDPPPAGDTTASPPGAFDTGAGDTDDGTSGGGEPADGSSSGCAIGGRPGVSLAALALLGLVAGRRRRL